MSVKSIYDVYVDAPKTKVKMTYHSATGRPQEKPSPDEDALAKVLMFVMGTAMITCVTATVGLGPVGLIFGAIAAQVMPRITTGSGQIMMITGAAVPTLTVEALKRLGERLQALKNALISLGIYFPYSIFADQFLKQIPDETTPRYDGPYPGQENPLTEAFWDKFFNLLARFRDYHVGVSDGYKTDMDNLNHRHEPYATSPDAYYNGRAKGHRYAQQIFALELWIASILEIFPAFPANTSRPGGFGGGGSLAFDEAGLGLGMAPGIVKNPVSERMRADALEGFMKAQAGAESDFEKSKEAAKNDDSNKPSKDKPYTGGRTQHELDELAKDPSHGNKMTNQGLKEREIGLELEKEEKLGRIIRDSQAEKGAEFIDESTGIKWDVKSFESYPNGHTSPKKGAFDVNNAMKKINTEISNGHNVIIDTRNMVSEHISQLQKAIDAADIGNLIIWYP